MQVVVGWDGMGFCGEVFEMGRIMKDGRTEGWGAVRGWGGVERKEKGGGEGGGGRWEGGEGSWGRCVRRGEVWMGLVGLKGFFLFFRRGKGFF